MKEIVASPIENVATKKARRLARETGSKGPDLEELKRFHINYNRTINLTRLVDNLPC